MSLHMTAGRLVAVEPGRVWFLIPMWRPLQPVALPAGAFQRFGPFVPGEWFAFEWNPRGRDIVDLYLCVIARCAPPGWETYYLNMIRATRTRRAEGRKRSFGTRWEYAPVLRERP